MDGCRVFPSQLNFLLGWLWSQGCRLPSLPCLWSLPSSTTPCFLLWEHLTAIEGEAEGICQGLLRGKEIILCMGAPQGEESILSALEMCGDGLEGGGCEQGSLALLGRAGGGVACSQG